ncbi:MAG TPA: class I tRNA ligase family protein [Ktedonobacteraceae bacterium]|nr:class I tRNA ligase family protein [Ktedonobacteraceae bacterium]
MKEEVFTMTNLNTSDAQSPWYITTAIPYVNAKPHIGFAQETILTDVLARYHRLKGDDVWFLTGTDENAFKNVQSAEQEGISTRALVDRNAAHFYNLRSVLNLSFDDFIRTSAEPRHKAGVEKLWQACDENGDIYKRPYSGLYCFGCEQFYSESELVNGLCPEHLTAPTLIEEENYFFRLSRYAERLYELIASNQLHIVPQKRKNEVLSFIRGGLNDFSISRSRTRAHGWGIPVPGDEDQVIYVWFDALGNYITALGYVDDAPSYQRYWLHNPHRTHVIGKGVIRFHAVYWPAMLLSAQVPLPTAILVHDYVTIDGSKISKSQGNTVDPVELVDLYGTDALRYYLLREIPSTADGDFTQERFLHAYNSDLADQLGNLLNRVVSMVGRYYGGTVPTPGSLEAVDLRLVETARNVRGQVDAALSRFALDEALDAIWNLVGAANKYVADVEPWTLAKLRKSTGEDSHAGERLSTVLYNLVEVLRLVAYHCAPFLPASAAGIAQQLGISLSTGEHSQDGSQEAEETSWGRYPAGTKVQPDSVLFPKIMLPTT